LPGSATIDPDGRPHLVPIVFVLDGQRLYSAVDAKPKRSRRLRRVANARERPDVTVLVDHYEDDWSRLWWAPASGEAAQPASGRHHVQLAGSEHTLSFSLPGWLSHTLCGRALA
jgi:PPOX class probable F420-dependent enzyme